MADELSRCGGKNSALIVMFTAYLVTLITSEKATARSLWGHIIKFSDVLYKLYGGAECEFTYIPNSILAIWRFGDLAILVVSSTANLGLARCPN